MEEGSVVDVRESCGECGLKKAVVRAGFLYCLECGIRAAESQPVMEFSQNVLLGSRVKSRKLVKEKSEKDQLSNMWSTWHAHNMILLGLVEETCNCGAGASLASTVLRLWSRWLRYNRVAFFSKRLQDAPRLSLGFNARDLQLLYGMKKKKKIYVTAQAEDTTEGNRKRAVRNKRALIKQEHEQFMSSQTSTVQMASQTLQDIKIKEEEQPKTILFGSAAKKHLKRSLTADKFQQHVEGGFCSSSCKCFRKIRGTVGNRKNKASIFNLYVLLFLGIRINNDDVQLGDLLRWCREGHLTFGVYKHFFPEDMTFKRSDRFSLSSSMMMHENVLITASRFASVLNLKGIKGPDLHLLIKRYIEELELPHELYGLVLKIFIFTDKTIDYYPLEMNKMPNYEALALSYIIIALKMLFGLDGVTENKISDCTNLINKVLDLSKNKKQLSHELSHEPDLSNFRRLFIWSDWTKYIEYRKICLSQFHYPTKMRISPDDCDNPGLFLHHQNKMRKVQPDGVVKNNAQSIIKSLLQRIEDNCSFEEKEYPTFQCSLSPFSAYIEDLLNWQYLNTPYSDVKVNRDILEESFSQYNITYLINSMPLKNILKGKGYLLYTHKYTPNCDLSVDRNLSDYLKKNTEETSKLDLKKVIEVFDCENKEWEMSTRIDNMYKTIDTKTEKTEETIVTLHSRYKIHITSPKKNDKDSNQVNFKKKEIQLKTLDLYLCFANYWVRHYPHLKTKYKQSRFDVELDLNFPPSFSWLLRECASIAEMKTIHLYSVLCDLEERIINKHKEKDKLKETEKPSVQDFMTTLDSPEI